MRLTRPTVLFYNCTRTVRVFLQKTMSFTPHRSARLARTYSVPSLEMPILLRVQNAFFKPCTPMIFMNPLEHTTIGRRHPDLQWFFMIVTCRNEPESIHAITWSCKERKQPSAHCFEKSERPPVHVETQWHWQKRLDVFLWSVGNSSV